MHILTTGMMIEESPTLWQGSCKQTVIVEESGLVGGMGKSSKSPLTGLVNNS